MAKITLKKINTEHILGEEKQADLIVTSCRYHISESTGIAGKLIRAAGDCILADMEAEGGTCPHGRAVVTESYELGSCGFVGFINPGNFSLSDGTKCLKNLETAVESVVEQAASLGCSSVLFPLLGCGKRRFPMALAVKAMVDGMMNHIGDGEKPDFIINIGQEDADSIRLLFEYAASEYSDNDIEVEVAMEEAEKAAPDAPEDMDADVDAGLSQFE